MSSVVLFSTSLTYTNSSQTSIQILSTATSLDSPYIPSHSPRLLETSSLIVSQLHFTIASISSTVKFALYSPIMLPPMMMKTMTMTIFAMAPTLSVQLAVRFRDQKRFHSVQVGKITAAMTGSAATSFTGRSRWVSASDFCNRALPHQDFVDKVDGDDQPQTLRFENTYVLDVSRLDVAHRSGRYVYNHIVTPLLRAWAHPSVIQPIRDTVVAFRPNIIPFLFIWATYPITSLQDRMWRMYRALADNPNLDDKQMDPSFVEMMSMLERILNYAHTGSAQVLIRGLMDRVWLSLGVIHDGLPAISSSFISYGSLTADSVAIRSEDWPVDRATRRPMTSSRRVQQLTYGEDHYETYEAKFTIRHAINHFPQDRYPSIQNDPLRVACYAAEIALRIYFDDVKNLVNKNVMLELSPLLLSTSSAVRSAARSRQHALASWLDSSLPLSYNPTTFQFLLLAVRPLTDGDLNLIHSSTGPKPLSFFVSEILYMCNHPNSRRRPPFIKGGNFLPVIQMASKEILAIADAELLQHADRLVFLSDALLRAARELQVNHVPWSPNPSGRSGNPSSIISHHTWLNLGHSDAPLTSPNAPFLSAHQSALAIARRTSEHIQASDPRGRWSVLAIGLPAFNSILHKSIPPSEFVLENASLDGSPQYVRDAYNHAISSFNPSLPLHQLAVFVALIFANLLPSAFAPKDIASPSTFDAYLPYIRSLKWVARKKSKGTTDKDPFIVMVITFILCLYDHDSPIIKRLLACESLDNWVSKHSTKGITAFMLCRLGLAIPTNSRAFRSARWLKDIKPLSHSQITTKHATISQLLRDSQKFGAYNAILSLAGISTIDALVDAGCLPSRNLPLPPSLSLPSSSKRTFDYMDADDGLTIASIDTFNKQKSARKY
ncbi:hypothetical protein M404DRAFT_940888 [Pisolithus tinctorius Marx 270]|uniref:Uncharacterized protein n=1 Tax=Pisolithus tinctorius Marx 270 TaxID=870435 RepID=A0A0C3MZK6_PISTI|nr:hypothetical protein M404DRAFT_940888 [Pisolithus tinctorius Marx 270]